MVRTGLNCNSISTGLLQRALKLSVMDASIILLRWLIVGDCREDPVEILNGEIASIKFFGNIWVSWW